MILAARKHDTDLPATLLTGYATKETTEEATSQNIDSMFKPIDIEELLNTTSRMVPRGR